MTSHTITCTRRIEFDAAHRVMGHEGKCKHMHGHHYVLEATFSAKGLDALGRVVDFGVIKEKLGGWINEHWDHNTVLFDKDKALGIAIHDVTGQAVYYVPSNPTVENMADYLLNTICADLFGSSDVMCVSLKLYETPNCFATVAAA